ncbi:hypothetical protein CBS12448_9977 [Aspergillus niger]|nr:hypothetical protein CBS12448_9977 [Aspergillus niger]
MRKGRRLVVNFARSEAMMRIFIEKWMPKGQEVELCRKQKKATEKGFLQEEKGLPKGYKVGSEHRVPDLLELKEFIRWYIQSTKGKLDPNGLPTMKSVLVWAQQFVPGFYLETGKEIPYHDRRDLYSWIEHDLVADKYIKNIQRPKHNFKLKSFERAMVAFWTIDDPFFMTGRVSSLTPASENKTNRGLRYKNIELVLFRDTEAPWKIGWRLDQQFVKNNQDPENTIFGTAIWDCDEPIYSGALYLLGMALADNALFGFSSAAEVFEQRIPEGEDELVLRWNDEARDRCIVRGTSASGVSEDPWTKERYHEGLSRCLANAGYFVTATTHAMRRELGKAVRAKYSSTLVAQILTHKSKSVYANDYLGNCSSVDVVNALKGRPLDHTHVDYFQGFERFHENGLIRRLPIEEEQKIDEDPSLIEISAKLKCAQSEDETRRLRREYSIQRRKIYSKKFQQYQSDWVRNRRDWKILTRGRERPEHIEQAAEKQVLCKLMPELGRLAAVISSNQALSFDEKASVVNDIHTHCLRQFDVVYLPGEEPQEGRCRVPACGEFVEHMKKPNRNTHVHKCHLQHFASERNLSPQQVKYCWECYTCHDGKSCEFEEHCAGHLPSMTSQHYEVIKYRHATIRAGYCIECMWNDGLSAVCRMRAFSRSTDLRNHMEEHLVQKSWPSECPDPSCNHISKEEQDYRRHLHDVHHYHKTICVAPKEAHKKRTSAMLDEKAISDRTQSMQHKHPRKRRKNAPDSPPRGSKELKINFWKPSTMPTEPMFETAMQDIMQERPQELAWQIENCQSTIALGEGRNSAVVPSVTLDTPDLTDDSSTCSSPSAVCSTFSAVDIDPQLLKLSQPVLSQQNEKIDQPDACTHLEQEEPQVGIEQLEIEGLHQMTDNMMEQELTGEDVTLPSMDIMPIEQTSSSLTKLYEESASYLNLSASISQVEAAPLVQGDSSVCPAESRTVEDLGPTGPITRAKAREQAAKSCQKPTDLYSLRRKALPYSREEDELLNLLMRELAAFDAVTPAFQKRFPNRSASSLRKRWSLIQPSSRRSTRSRILTQPQVY